MFDSRLGCSTISFRHLPLRSALEVIGELGFTEIDLGSLPGVCDHVPLDLDDRGVREVVEAVQRSGLAVRSINCDVGDMNNPATDLEASLHLERLLELASRVGAHALVLPNGALTHEPIESLDSDLDRVAANLNYASTRAHRHGVDIWTESLHVFRLCCTTGRAVALAERIDPAIGIVMDFSHIVASGGDPAHFARSMGSRISHVHIRDSTRGEVRLDEPDAVDKPGNINISVGRGEVDFRGGIDALGSAGFTGHFALELETRDISDKQRPAATAAAGDLITELLLDTHQEPS
ncbi:xylose isomerase [Rhodococcus sp. 06-462-5]|uniref:sugar phosphate isomerase/epimerase family protein n=1 Tax=unclassified Rhodococcus (in: high G+C Gram-positive bacteria) TaxID=192944 RepID=UPI000B9A2C1C|nr:MULTISPECIES: sugar phosphate isomerase/epimerase [unclassified Rhodococcus (in: high G+C Gram-positive bacteria)]OZC68346.1 xylose isomerase [Rhodococcus sp. 06-462-5]OZE66174.1 xylose isomerase [Rhodococcus sp. 02-925g]